MKFLLFWLTEVQTRYNFLPETSLEVDDWSIFLSIRKSVYGYKNERKSIALRSYKIDIIL